MKNLKVCLLTQNSEKFKDIFNKYVYTNILNYNKCYHTQWKLTYLGELMLSSRRKLLQVEANSVWRCPQNLQRKFSHSPIFVD